MTAHKVKSFSPYSDDVTSALRIFSTLGALRAPDDPADQLFIDRLTANALRHVSEGLRKQRLAMGVRQDEEGLARCALAIGEIGCRTSAPIACSKAAAVVSSGRGCSHELAVLDAAAFALGGAA